jgi:hypothetical protein
MNPPAAEILQRALAQLDQAGAIVLQLGKMFDGSLHVERGNGRCYRVRFMNRFARGRNTISACQRSVVIPSAEWREAAIETAKRCFAELEGIPDWTLHATFIEAELLEDDTADRWQQHSADIPYAINTGTTEELQ